ncbi:MAG: hypothetical protein GX133_00555 [Syntrophomonadaceae bacterium]|nr:hypothetical protein [Syntrophomonadaceae bacterium]
MKQEGIPFDGALEDGDKDDKAWNKELLEKYRQIEKMMPEPSKNKPLYVAGSALITPTNLNSQTSSRDLSYQGCPTTMD